MTPSGFGVGAFGPGSDPAYVHEWGCPDCGATVRIRHDNALRLLRAASFAYGGIAGLAIDVSRLPAVDWTADVPDRVIGQAVLAAIRPQA